MVFPISPTWITEGLTGIPHNRPVFWHDQTLQTGTVVGPDVDRPGRWQVDLGEATVVSGEGRVSPQTKVWYAWKDLGADLKSIGFLKSKIWRIIKGGSLILRHPHSGSQRVGDWEFALLGRISIDNLPEMMGPIPPNHWHVLHANCGIPSINYSTILANSMKSMFLSGLVELFHPLCLWSSI